MKKKVAFQKKIEFPTMIGEISAISLEQDLKFIDDSNVEGNLLLTGKYKLTEASRLEEAFSYKIPTEITLIEKLDLDTAKVEITDFSYEIENEDTLVCNIELLVEGLEVIDLDDNDEDAEIGPVHQEELVRKVELPISNNSDAIESKKIDERERGNEKEELIHENDDRKVQEPEVVERECDGDKKETKEIELPMIEKTEEKEEKREEMIEKKSEEKETSKESSLFINLNDEQDTYGTFLVYIVRQNENINSIIEKYHTTLEEIEKYNNLNDLGIGTKLIIPILND